jgi:GNAT superfamily N-acetyltransferase
MALVVCVPDAAGEDIVAMARYDVTLATNLADIAFVVRDEWQGKGIGTLLLTRMCEIARARGLSGFTADVLRTNRPMISVFQKSGLTLEVEALDETYHIVARLEKWTAPPRS